MVDRKVIVVRNDLKERKTDDDKQIRESSSLKDTEKISFVVLVCISAQARAKRDLSRT